MYGMVNEAIRSMIIETGGNEAWETIANIAKIKNVEGFASFEQYDDQVTLDLVANTSAHMNIEVTKLLESFGLYWVDYAKKSEYSSILEAAAKNPIDLLKNLNALHKRLELTFDNLNAPSFWVENLTENSLDLYYKSQRDMPLEFFVIGLVKGIFKLYDATCDVEIASEKKDGVVVFNVRF